MSTAFDNIPDWPEQPQAADRHHNQPPLEERVLMDFEDQLRTDGLLDRITDITASAGRVPAIDSQVIAGKVGDLIAQARAAGKAVEERRETHNRPLLTAQRALKGRADALLAPMVQSIDGVRRSLDAYMAEESRKAREAERLAQEQARIAREAAEKAAAEAAKAGQPAPPPPAPIIEPARIEKPVARGDMGACVSTKTVWKSEVENYKQAFAAVANNANVQEAIDKAVSALVRSGTRQIKGVRIFEDTVANVR